MIVLLEYINLLQFSLAISYLFEWAWTYQPHPWLLSCIKHYYIGVVYAVDLKDADGRRVCFARLVYTVSNVQGNYALFGLQVRGVSTIQGFLMYTSNGSSSWTWVNVSYKEVVCHSRGVYLEGFHCIAFCIYKLSWYNNLLWSSYIILMAILFWNNLNVFLYVL